MLELTLEYVDFYFDFNDRNLDTSSNETSMVALSLKLKFGISLQYMNNVSLRSATAADAEFAIDCERQTMRPYAMQT